MVFGPKGRLVWLGGLILAPCVARRSLLWKPGSAPPARPGVPLVQKPQGTPIWSLHTRGCGRWAPRCLLGGPLRGVVRSLRRDFRPLEGGVRTSRNAADIARELSPLRHAGRLHFAVGPPYCQPTHTSVAAVKGCLPDHPRRGRQNASCGALARGRCGASCMMGPTHVSNAWPLPPRRATPSRWLNYQPNAPSPCERCFGRRAWRRRWWCVAH